MRPPEARFEPNTPLSFSANIWSLAVAIWDIIGMATLFSIDYVSPDKIVAEHIDALGPMPTDWWKSWEGKNKFFHEDGSSKDRQVWPPLSGRFEEAVQNYRQARHAGEFNKDEAAAILDLLRRMLSYRPEERPTAEDVLQSDWMVKWALPCYERSLRE